MTFAEIDALLPQLAEGRIFFLTLNRGEAAHSGRRNHPWFPFGKPP
jgi:hypothetical protein